MSTERHEQANEHPLVSVQHRTLLHVDLGTFHFRRLHKSAIKALLRNIQRFFTADNDMKLNITPNSLLFPLQQWLRGCVTMLLYMHIV
jgi:hypothetical protein